MTPGTLTHYRRLGRDNRLGPRYLGWVVYSGPTRTVLCEVGFERCVTLCRPEEVSSVVLAPEETQRRHHKPCKRWVRMLAREAR